MAPPTLLPGTEKLARIADKELSLTVLNKGEDATAGHQYLMLLFPVGSVVVPHPDEFVNVLAIQDLAERGVRVTPAAARRLTLEIEELSLSAFDLFFVRRLHGSIALTVRIEESGRETRHAQVHEEEALFARFGFARDLQGVLQIATTRALRKGFDELRLGAPASPDFAR